MEAKEDITKVVLDWKWEAEKREKRIKELEKEVERLRLEIEQDKEDLVNSIVCRKDSDKRK